MAAWGGALQTHDMGQSSRQAAHDAVWPGLAWDPAQPCRGGTTLHCRLQLQACCWEGVSGMHLQACMERGCLTPQTSLGTHDSPGSAQDCKAQEGGPG